MRTNSTYSVEIFSANLFETSGYLWRGDNTGHWVTISHWLADRHNIWDHVLRLKRPHVTNATKADLNFVGDADATSFMNISIEMERC